MQDIDSLFIFNRFGFWKDIINQKIEKKELP